VFERERGAAIGSAQEAFLPIWDGHPPSWYDPVVNVIVKDRDILGGTPVFRGTRVPIQTLSDYLQGGEKLEDFLKGFPTVTRESAVAVLEEAKDLLLARS
jgi:uncharacterized protein (DUF433 family)